MWVDQLSPFKRVDAIDICFHFRWVLKLLTSHKCHCSHPVEIHAHPLSTIVMALSQWSLLQRATVHLTDNRAYQSTQYFNIIMTYVYDVSVIYNHIDGCPSLVFT